MVFFKQGQATFLDVSRKKLDPESMPRAPRIEFEEACYHIMASGNHREPIVFDEEDRKRFVKTVFVSGRPPSVGGLSAADRARAGTR